MKPINILLVEDNAGDILLTTEALEEGRIANRVDVVKDGKAAIDYLDKVPPYELAILPDLILLDVNLPKKNGHEVLRYIKTSEKLRHIPVIMLTTSSTERDITLSYKNHANCFITKPVEVDDFMAAIAKIEDFWMTVVKLPATKKM